MHINLTSIEAAVREIRFRGNVCVGPNASVWRYPFRVCSRCNNRHSPGRMVRLFAARELVPVSGDFHRRGLLDPLHRDDRAGVGNAADAGQHLGEKAMEFIELGAGPPGVRTSTGIRYGLKSEMARGPLPRIDMRTRVSDGRYLNEQSAAERRRLAARIGSRRQRSFRSFGHGYKRRQQ